MELQTCFLFFCSLVLVKSSTVKQRESAPPITASTSNPVTTTSPLSCPSGWLDAHDEGCFQFLPDAINLTWTRAMSACESAGGYLAEPKTHKQMEFLVGVAALELQFTGVANWWLGLTDMGLEGRWMWIHSMETVRDSFWIHNSPSDKPGNNEDCGFAVFHNNQLLWKDQDCSEQMANGNAIGCVCQHGDLDEGTSTSTPYQTTPTMTTAPAVITTLPNEQNTTAKPTTCPPGWSHFKGNCYWAIEMEYTWTEARKQCQALGADLASSHSTDQNGFFSKMLNSDFSKKAWLGGIDTAEEGTWTWVDGTDFDYHKWANSEGDSGPAQNCIAMRRDDYWFDMGCFELHWAICSIYI